MYVPFPGSGQEARAQGLLAQPALCWARALQDPVGNSLLTKRKAAIQVVGTGSLVSERLCAPFAL